MSINYPAGIDEGLYIETILTKVRSEYLPNDIFDSLSANFINPTADEPMQIPQEVYLKIQADATKSRTIKVAMRKEFSGAPNLGSNADPRLTEEDAELKFWTIRYTDLSKTTANQNYGIGAIEKKPFNVFEYRVEGMATWYKQYFGKMRRQTLLQLQSENLEDAPHFLPSGLSPSWFIPNRSAAQQPVWVTDPQDWVDTVAAAVTAAGTGISACASLGFFMELEDWARGDGHKTPILFPDGSDGYVITLPTPQKTWLLKLIQDGNVGYLWTAAASMSQDVLKKYPNSIGRFQGLHFVEDSRYPTITIGGSASNSGSYLSDGGADYTITCKYYGCGRADDGTSDPRDKTANARQIGFLLAANAMGEVMPEDFHWEYEYEMYDKYFGAGIFCSVGMEQVRFDVTSGDATTMQQDGSAVIPFAVPPTGNYYTQAT
jgi:hypothetical protein